MRSLRPFPHRSTCGLVEVEIAEVDTERLRDTCAGSPEKKQQAPITSSARRSLIRRIDQGVKFFSGQMMCHLGVRLLQWDCEDALRDAERGRVVRCNMTEERPDGGKSCIPGLYGVLSLRLKVIQEGEDKIAIEIGDCQCTGFPLCAPGCEQDQQA